MKEFIVTPDLYANKGQRIVNLLLDLIVLFVSYMALLFALGIIVTLIGGDIDSMAYQMENINPLLDRLISAIVVATFYFIIESALKGRTIGKYASNTKVVTINGEVPSTIAMLKRSFSRVIPFDMFSFLGAEGRGWHDTIPNLYVVDVKKFEEKKTIQSGLEELGTGERDEITGATFR